LQITIFVVEWVYIVYVKTAIYVTMAHKFDFFGSSDI